MKAGLSILPLMCLASVALAAGDAETNPPVPSGAAPGMEPAHYRMAKGKKKNLPSGDLRPCLELKTSKEIIRCSEKRHK
tara:strand:+ start:93 stop:329 length:237 start_codon:yes stop_codon:yes gene_type:complete